MKKCDGCLKSTTRSGKRRLSKWQRILRKHEKRSFQSRVDRDLQIARDPFNHPSNRVKRSLRRLSKLLKKADRKCFWRYRCDWVNDDLKRLPTGRGPLPACIKFLLPF